ncbi:uncharacterized protein LOC133910596 [Phragmites australis]|uniref:uncharacterized protein LOC133910596 n=1 Tax=Phragmites australis TaxID=29695 RepID=UPI002D79F788|nr:uncharacterized protein LOC133910596 [Phragmites australis]
MPKVQVTRSDMVVVRMVEVKVVADFAVGFKRAEAVDGKGQMVAMAVAGFTLGVFVTHRLLHVDKKSRTVGSRHQEPCARGGAVALVSYLPATRRRNLLLAAAPLPFPDLSVILSATAYELLVAASRATGAKTLTYIPQSASASSSSSSSLQTTTASSNAKGAPGLRPSVSPNDGRPTTAAELVRMQMGVTEQADARISRGLFRIAADDRRMWETIFQGRARRSM